MKLVSYLNNGKEQVAFYIDHKLYNLSEADARLPQTIMPMLEDWEAMSAIAQAAEQKIKSGASSLSGVDFDAVTILAPVPRPTSCRDGYAFRQHVAAARRV
jgi:fumarylacetoacetate (FAA) hydrolase